MINVTWQSSGYDPADVRKRYVRCSCNGVFSFCEVNEGRWDIRQGTVSADELPEVVRLEAERFKGLTFGHVDWPL